jgi:hypothetical protein
MPWKLPHWCRARRPRFRPRARSPRLKVEGLETRLTPTVTKFGPNLEVTDGLLQVRNPAVGMGRHGNYAGPTHLKVLKL